MRAAKVARFPGAPCGRIPNFTGAERAAEMRLRGLRQAWLVGADREGQS